MNRLNFESDYTNGAHSKVLQKLVETNDELLSTYGTDVYTENAKNKIKSVCGTDNLDVFFLAGGTQTNSVVISSVLNRYEGVLAADTGHINAHEAGAIEYNGHKILALSHNNGKIDVDVLTRYLKDFYDDANCEHMVYPGMVYISHPTEFGTLYSKSELEKISRVCHKYGLTLFMDGARLGYGIMSDETDVTLKDIVQLCDVFYIGGTKVGALCGEAVVFNKKTTPNRFITQIKQHGALLAKGRVLGVQFDALFTDDLYFEISRHAIEMAHILKTVLKENGMQFAWDSPTNQQFVVLENSLLAELEKSVKFGFWEKYDNDHTVVRFATSWSTKEEDIHKLNTILKNKS